MSTPTDKSVMLALLSLDAYSRGDLPQLTYKDDIGLPDQVGNATVLANSKGMKGMENADIASFSASAYTWAVDLRVGSTQFCVLG